MYSRLPDCEDLQPRDLANEHGLEAVSGIIYEDVYKTSRRTLKHPIFNADIPKQLL